MHEALPLATNVPPAPREEPQLLNDLFLRACRRLPVTRTPVWMMRQAGRYLPEYRALREKHDFLTSCRTPELACELTLQPVTRLDVDAAILFSDILVPLPGMGVEVEFVPGPHIAQPVRTPEEIERLRVPDPREATPFLLEAIRLTRLALSGRVPLIGFAGAPFTLATYLVEGGASKSFATLKALLFGSTDAAHLLLRKCADTVAASLVEQVRAGAQAVMLFDTWAGILAPGDHEEFALAYARRVFDSVAAALPRSRTVPRIYYAGEAGSRLALAPRTGADVIGVDWRIDLGEARRLLGPDVAVQGNLDPGVLLGPPALIRERVAAVLRSARATQGASPAIGHIFNLGHGILPQTPPDNAQILVAAVRELSASGDR